MTIFRAFALLLAWAAFMGMFFPKAEAEGGMIPFDSPVGEIGGRGHWYALRTMNGELYWEDPAVISDIKENEDGTYSVSGEPPVSLSIVLHPGWYPEDEPWRRAIDWVRQAEQVFRNSGVPIRFVIERISVWEDFPDTVEAAYKALNFTKYEFGADLVVGLKPVMAGDPYCGVASMRGALSISSCGPLTLTHELGHNFGLYHSHDAGHEGQKGICFSPEPDAYECSEGTVMSYAGQGRVPLFANKDFTYKGNLLGNEEHDAVAHLNKVKAAKALRWELAYRDQPSSSYYSGEPDYHLCR